MAMYQLGMLEFLEDIDRYMLELSRRNSPDSSSSFVTALCTRWAPGHNPNCCPLRRRTPQSSSSSSPNTSHRSSGSFRCSPVPTPPPHRSHSPYPRPWRPRNRNRSPISDQDDIDVYEDISGDGIIDSVGWSNITGSPCGSESGYF